MNKRPLIYIILSASLFGISPPLAKLLVKQIAPLALAGLLYLGAFVGLFLYSFIGRRKISHDKKTPPLGRKDIPWLAGAILAGGILAPVSMMMGLRRISGFSASLLLNMEGIATAIIAVLFFKENAGKRLWLALACMTAAGIFLSWDPSQSRFSTAGQLLLLLAMVFWGIDNNLTRHISDKDPIQIAEVKGVVAGTISLSLAFLAGIRVELSARIALALLLGTFSYGFSLVLFIKALEGLGSSRTGAFFSFAPFIGAIASLVLLREWIGWVMFPAVAFMLIGVWLLVGEKHSHIHHHMTHTHTHMHKHDDLHHFHEHTEPIYETHSHDHTHHDLTHDHDHWPDTHHRHEHNSMDSNSLRT